MAGLSVESGLEDDGGLACVTKVSLDLDDEIQISAFELFRSALAGALNKAVQRGLNNVRRLQIVRRGMRVSGEVVVGVELDARNVFLEQRYRDGAGKLLAPAPHQVQPLAEHG